ncbi:MAG: hypothetical protein IH956_03515 [Chloroflexi bacterium]|nr:hypothetical protein [Chloroflexota bacterium]
MTNGPDRKVPRPFSLHWGGGLIVEEASHVGEHHRPALQLLEFEDGSLSVRFCYYDHAGRFQRSPLILGRDDVSGLRDALAETPRLRSVLAQLTG